MKSYTDLEQSKKLAKILPIESADMSWVEKENAKHTWYDAENRRIITKYEKKYYIPCWSLAALLKILSDITDYSFELVFLKRTTDGRANTLEDVYRLSTDVYDVYKKEAVDACYEIIIKNY